MSAYYVDVNTGVTGKLIETTVPTKVGYRNTPQAPAAAFVSGHRASPIQRDRRFAVPCDKTGLTLPFAFPFFGRRVSNDVDQW